VDHYSIPVSGDGNVTNDKKERGKRGFRGKRKIAGYRFEYGKDTSVMPLKRGAYRGIFWLQ